MQNLRKNLKQTQSKSAFHRKRSEIGTVTSKKQKNLHKSLKKDLVIKKFKETVIEPKQIKNKDIKQELKKTIELELVKLAPYGQGESR